jgi:hypothetical protein
MRKLACCLLLLIAAACKDSTEKEVPIPGKACFNFPSELMHGDEGTFDASCSSADTYTWAFGDGTEYDDPIVKHTFLAPGRYFVNLTIYKDGKRDDIYGYININSTEQEQKCVPAYVTGISLWPYTAADSVVFLYGANKKVIEIDWYKTGETGYIGRANFGYDAEGKMNGIEFNNLHQDGFPNLVELGISYGADELPTRMEIYHGLAADFTHDLGRRLTRIKYTDPAYPSISQTTLYEYDAYGNTTNVAYTGYGTKGEGRANTAFYSTLTFYSPSKDLKFFFEYVIGIEPYVNSLKWATVKADRNAPGYSEFRSYTDPDMNNPPGIDREYAIKVDSKTNLPVRLSPNTGDVIGTDLTFRNVVYACDL